MRGVILFLCASASYGFAVGSMHSWLYSQRNLVKFPLLMTVTGGVCALAYFVVARFATSKISARDVAQLTFGLFHDLSILLASLAPVSFFLGRAMASAESSPHGEYDLFLALNIFFIAVAGTIALVRQARALMIRLGLERRLAVLLTTSWLLLSLAVGGEAAFFLRPFFGIPSTRGETPPFALRDAPAIRGAQNFYEVVWFTLEGRPR